MFASTWNIDEALDRLDQEDTTLMEIYLCDRNYTDADLKDLLDKLLIHPNIVTNLLFENNRLTDETGIKIAQLVASSTTIRTLRLSSNLFGLATYEALAKALHTNTSLDFLSIYRNNARKIDWPYIERKFVEALRINPGLSGPLWWLFEFQSNKYHQLKREAETLPDLQTVLIDCLI